MKRLVTIILILVVFSIKTFAAVEATVSPTKVQVGETFRLILKNTANQDMGVPDLSPLQTDFKITGTERNSNYTVINGKGHLVSEWIIYLMATKVGAFTIPSLHFGNEQTDSLQVEVTGESQPKAMEQGDEIFIKTQVDEKKPYVNQQILYTVKVYIKNQLLDAQYQPPTVQNALLLTIGQQQYTARFKQKDYTVSEQTYAIFPEKSGELSINPPHFSAVVYKAVPEKVEIKAQPTLLQVQPSPSNGPSQRWFPAKQLSLKEKYDTEATTLDQGATFTRTITVKALGAPAQLLPPLPLKSKDAFTVYPEKIQEKNQADHGDILGTVTFKVSYLINKSGDVVIPVLKMPWFNVATGQAEEAMLPARRFRVTPTASIQPSHGQVKATKTIVLPVPTLPPVINTPSSEKTVWLPWIIAACLGLGWFITVLAYRMKFSFGGARRRLKALKTACFANDPKAAKNHLILWAVWRWQMKKINDLEDICIATHDMDLKNAINTLSRCLYYTEEMTSWKGEALWKAVANHARLDSGKQDETSSLPPLKRFP